MRVVLTGASGLVGSNVVAALKRRDDDVTVLSRRPEKARERLGVDAQGWDPNAGAAPAAALAGADAVIHLAGEPVAQRWTEASKRRIRDSRVHGTRNLVAGIRAAEPGPRALVSASAVGYYGPRGDEEIGESEPPGDDFLAAACREWEAAAAEAAADGVRVVTVRTGVVLDPAGGALAKMLPPFKLGIGGPVAGGKQWLPWIHVDDVVGIYLAALDGESWSGPVNAAAPAPATNAEFSKALGRALHRPAFAPVPGFALKVLYGDMAQIVTTGQRVVPKRPLALGYAFQHPALDEALRSALG
ncbi:MAG: hypothetical protein JWN32_1756 [Solirubrobacterales bacterium]|nr:hypothetical protein [Solirubrobacterales bacterium]